MDQPKSNDYIPYGEREEWKDIEPVLQDDGPKPIAPILYSFEYKDAMNYFRAISAKEEMSQRAFDLTETIIYLNPSHYTIWLYRQRIIKELNLDLKQELEFLQQLVEDNPKCYQLWQHRQFIVDKLDDSSGEDEFISIVLEDDNKNFHAWSYRQWTLKRFNLFEKELSFVTDLIDKDIRNNSAWNQRFFVLTKNPNQNLNENILKNEIEFTINKIKQVPFNEAPFNYLKGMFIHFYGDKEFAPHLLKVVDGLDVKSKHLYSWKVDVYSILASGNQENVKLGLEACQKLLNMDIVRAKYWQFRLDQFQQMLE